MALPPTMGVVCVYVECLCPRSLPVSPPPPFFFLILFFKYLSTPSHPRKCMHVPCMPKLHWLTTCLSPSAQVEDREKLPQAQACCCSGPPLCSCYSPKDPWLWSLYIVLSKDANLTFTLLAVSPQFLVDQGVLL